LKNFTTCLHAGVRMYAVIRRPFSRSVTSLYILYQVLYHEGSKLHT
jgi:hypothetical protein